MLFLHHGKGSRKSLILPSVTLLWLALAAFGLTRLWQFEGRAGADGHPPSRWQPLRPPLRPPERSLGATLRLDPVKPTLILLIHPQCPCSRASLTELNRLAALCPDRAALTVWFLRPPGYTVAWTRTDLWRQASAIPGVSVCVDDNGSLAARLGAATSGEAVLYAPDGRLLYQGGLTGARGHEGDNAGLSAVAALLSGRNDASRQEPVYGCPLTADRQKSSGDETLRSP